MSFLSICQSQPDTSGGLIKSHLGSKSYPPTSYPVPVTRALFRSQFYCLLQPNTGSDSTFTFFPKPREQPFSLPGSSAARSCSTNTSGKQIEGGPKGVSVGVVTVTELAAEARCDPTRTTLQQAATWSGSRRSTYSSVSSSSQKRQQDERRSPPAAILGKKTAFQGHESAFLQNSETKHKVLLVSPAPNSRLSIRSFQPQAWQ